MMVFILYIIFIKMCLIVIKCLFNMQNSLCQPLILFPLLCSVVLPRMSSKAHSSNNIAHTRRMVQQLRIEASIERIKVQYNIKQCSHFPWIFIVCTHGTRSTFFSQMYFPYQQYVVSISTSFLLFYPYLCIRNISHCFKCHVKCYWRY